jgi:hypothetical protein
MSFGSLSVIKKTVPALGRSEVIRWRKISDLIRIRLQEVFGPTPGETRAKIGMEMTGFPVL